MSIFLDPYLQHIHPGFRVHAPAPKMEKKDKKKQRQQVKEAAGAASSGTFNIPRYGSETSDWSTLTILSSDWSS